MSDIDETLRRLEKLKADCEQRLRDVKSGTRRIHVDKKTHRIKFEEETEDEVTIVIENRKNIKSD